LANGTGAAKHHLNASSNKVDPSKILNEVGLEVWG